MRRGCSRAFSWVLVALILVPAIAAAGATDMEAVAGQGAMPAASGVADGRRFYEKGIGVSGEAVQSYVGEGLIPLPASAMPCSSCHGPDGRGRPEGGLDPTDIRWAAMTKPYGHTHRSQGGHSHPAYDVESLLVSLVEGVDPSGYPFDPGMPRYAVSREDVAALVDYLRALDHGIERGVTQDRVTMGTVVPAVGPAAQSGLVLRSMTAALMDEVNEAGGIHGRTMQLVTIETGETPEETAEAVRLTIREHALFALIAPFAPGAEAELARVAREEGVPVIAPFEPFPLDGRSRGDLFHVFPTNSRQMELLLRHARDGGQDRGGTVILHDGQADAAALANGLAGEPGGGVTARAYDGNQPMIDRLTAEAGEKRYGRILYLAAAEGLAPLAAALVPQQPGIDLLLPGWSAGLMPVATRAGWQGRILIGLPIDADGLSPDARRKIREVSLPFGFGGSHMPMQITAYAAVELASEAMRRAGRSLRVDTFRAALEALDDHDFGLGAPVSYGRNRRHGLDGIRVIEFSATGGRWQQTADWVTGD